MCVLSVLSEPCVSTSTFMGSRRSKSSKKSSYKRSYSSRKGFSKRTAYGQRDTALNVIKVMCAGHVSPAMY